MICKRMTKTGKTRKKILGGKRRTVTHRSPTANEQRDKIVKITQTT